MRSLGLGVLFGTCLSICAPTAAAQGMANTFGELRLLVRAGETITVIDTGGRAVSGRIEVLSASSLVVADRAGRHAWTEADVASIRQVRSDSLGNGALIGLGAGAGFGFIGMLASGADFDHDAGWILVATGFYAGIGTGIGVGVDALIRRESVIYESAPPRTQVRVAPMLAPRRRGLLVTVGF